MRGRYLLCIQCVRKIDVGSRHKNYMIVNNMIQIHHTVHELIYIKTSICLMPFEFTFL
jgi:hypothetical protein